MIAALKGTLFFVGPEHLVIDVQGVFYELFAPLGLLSDWSARVGQNVFIYCYMNVREDAMNLFGFESLADKALFLSLLKVTGVGPKMALGIMSGAKSDQIIYWIEQGDSKALTQLPKLGKKTAEQLILTLRGKLPAMVTQMSSDSGSLNKSGKSAGGMSGFGEGVKAQLASALLNLGFRTVNIEEVLAKLPHDIELEQGLRQALKDLS